MTSSRSVEGGLHSTYHTHQKVMELLGYDMQKAAFYLNSCIKRGFPWTKKDDSLQMTLYFWKDAENDGDVYDWPSLHSIFD